VDLGLGGLSGRCDVDRLLRLVQMTEEWGIRDEMTTTI
jgi:hypothetical protein